MMAMMLMVLTLMLTLTKSFRADGVGIIIVTLRAPEFQGVCITQYCHVPVGGCQN